MCLIIDINISGRINTIKLLQRAEWLFGGQCQALGWAPMGGQILPMMPEAFRCQSPPESVWYRSIPASPLEAWLNEGASLAAFN